MKLKLCPFCGNIPTLKETWEYNWPCYHKIECIICGSSSRPYLQSNDAVKAWNKRMKR